MATKKATQKSTKKTADQPLASEAPAPATTKRPRATRHTRARSAAEAEEKLGAQEVREDATRAKQGATKGARRTKKPAAPPPAQEQPTEQTAEQRAEQLPSEPTTLADVPEPAKKPSRKRTKRASAPEPEPWNPTISLRWDDESEPCWTGTFDELAEANQLDEDFDKGWLNDVTRDLRERGEHKGGGGAAPSYTLAVLPSEPTPTDAELVAKRTIAALPKPPDTSPAKVTSATLLDAARGFVAHIETEGASLATVSGYRRELQVALEHFGESTLLCALTPRKVQNYFESDAVMVARNGQPKAEPSWQRTRRVLRLALVWAAEQGLVEEAPLPEKRRASKKQQDAGAAS